MGGASTVFTEFPILVSPERSGGGTDSIDPTEAYAYSQTYWEAELLSLANGQEALSCKDFQSGNRLVDLRVASAHVRKFDELRTQFPHLFSESSPGGIADAPMSQRALADLEFAVEGLARELVSEQRISLGVHELALQDELKLTIRADLVKSLHKYFDEQSVPFGEHARPDGVWLQMSSASALEVMPKAISLSFGSHLSHTAILTRHVPKVQHLIEKLGGKCLGSKFSGYSLYFQGAFPRDLGTFCLCKFGLEKRGSL